MSRTISRSAVGHQKPRESVSFRFRWGEFINLCFYTGGGEAVATLGQDLHQVVSQVATSQVQTEDGVGQSVT